MNMTLRPWTLLFKNDTAMELEHREKLIENTDKSEKQQNHDNPRKL